MAVKSRIFLTNSGKGIERAWNGRVLAIAVPKPYNLGGSQKTISQGHEFYLLGKTKLDIGGGFDSWYAAILPSPDGEFSISNGPKVGSWYEFQGRLFPWWTDKYGSASDYITPISDAQLNAYGTTGIARAIPTNPLSGMGQFLGELRDLPKIPDIRNWKKRVQNLRSSKRSYGSNARQGASEYLNQQFGWIPFVKDLKDFTNVVRKADAHIKQFDRDSGRHVRRRRKIFENSTTETTVVSTNGYPYPSLNANLLVAPGVLTKTVTTTTKVWFAGAFTYYLPPADPSGLAIGSKRAEQLRNRLFGLRVTPDLVWKLAPWSWAVDWVSNVGDIVHNWSAFQNDSLVLHYGYVMSLKTQETTYSLTGLRTCDGRTINLTQTMFQSVKQRRKATPYGFGLNVSGFSPKQWSIIAALGISRSPRALHL